MTSHHVFPTTSPRADMTSQWLWVLLVTMVTATTSSVPRFGAIDFYAKKETGNIYGKQWGKYEQGRDVAKTKSLELCPVQCSCYRRRLQTAGTRVHEPLFTVNCSSKGLYDFPDELPNNTQVLDISHNKLQNLTELPRLANLQVLDVSSNWLRHLDNKWIFEHVPQIHTLNLADNALKAIQHGSFSGLGGGLRHLDLSHNIIRQVELHAFSSLDGLQTLHLDQNDLFQLKREWFLPLTYLSSLYLSHNHIAKLEPRLFDKLTRLQELDLSHNQLRLLPDDAFAGMTRLQLLNLSGNSQLRGFPAQAGRELQGLKILLMDAVAAPRLPSFAVSSLQVMELSLSYLPELRVIEKSAFFNLTRLTVLQLHDNPKLVYIHPAAFSSLPNLKHLLLHNNALAVVPQSFLTALPALTDFHIHHNPLRCDCNIYWLRQRLGVLHPSHHLAKTNDAVKSNHVSPLRSTINNSLSSNPSMAASLNSSTLDLIHSATLTNQTRISSEKSKLLPNYSKTPTTDDIIREAERISCFFPSGHSSIPLYQLPLQYFSPTCPPSTLSLFSNIVNVTLGEELWLECQGIGVPVPSISWVIPSGQEMNLTSSRQTKPESENLNEKSRVEIVEETLLFIRSVTLTDTGIYTCRAVNSFGEDFSTTTVHVQNRPLMLIDVLVSNDCIIVSWRGSIPRMQMKNYQIFYKQVSQSSNRKSKLGKISKVYSNSWESGILNPKDFHVLQLHGAIHRSLISGLDPQTDYLVCLVYRRSHRVQCKNYTTTMQDVRVVRAGRGIVTVNRVHVGVGIACVMAVVFLLFCVLAISKARQRKQYRDPIANDDKSSIPLDGVVSTAPNTPLTSSRTALLTNTQI